MVYYGLLLYFVLEYVRPTSYVPALEVLHLNAIVPLSVFMGSMASNGQVALSEVLTSKNARWIMFLLLLIGISGLICDVKTFAWLKFEAVVGYFLVFLVLKKELYDLGRIKGVLATLVFVHLAVAALNPELLSGDGERHYIASGAFLGDGNDFALSVNIAIPLCMFLMLESQSRIKKVLYGSMLGVLILAVVATQSRGGILALSSVGLYYWIKSDRKILGIAGIAIVIFIVFAVAPAQFFDRMATMTQTGDEMEGSAQGRIVAWGAAMRMAADNPLFGVGAGHFPVAFGTKFRPEGEGPMPWLTAHSSYFLLLGELGIPGIMFLLGIIVSNLIAGERVLREVSQGEAQQATTCTNLMIALNAGLIAFAVGGAFISAAYYPHIFLLAGLLQSGRDVSRKLMIAEAIAPKSQAERVFATSN